MNEQEVFDKYLLMRLKEHGKTCRRVNCHVILIGVNATQKWIDIQLAKEFNT